jgi:hypothetical protein
VEQASVGIAGSALLGGRMLQQQFESLSRMIKPDQWLTSTPTLNLSIDAVASDNESGKQQEVHQPNVVDVPVDLACGFVWIH